MIKWWTGDGGRVDWGDNSEGQLLDSWAGSMDGDSYAAGLSTMDGWVGVVPGCWAGACRQVDWDCRWGVGV
jgi:hypothetical protein